MNEKHWVVCAKAGGRTAAMEKKTGKSYKILMGAVVFTIIIGLLVVGGWNLYMRFTTQTIPGLERMDGFIDSFREVYLIAYDGKTERRVIEGSMFPEQREAAKKTLRKITSCRGKKATDWTKDMITYPIYSLTIRPRHQDGKEIRGETVVWSNGYLMTNSGDVYECDVDFEGMFYVAKEENSGWKYNEYEIDHASKIRQFRPLAYADLKWNADMLVLSEFQYPAESEGIVVKLEKQYKENEYQVVKVALKNNSEKDWKYSNEALDVSLEVLVDGKWYCLRHDPDISDSYLNGGIHLNQHLRAGKEMTCEIALAFFGPLPPGEYRIGIPARFDEDYCDAFVCFSVDKW